MELMAELENAQRRIAELEQGDRTSPVTMAHQAMLEEALRSSQLMYALSRSLIEVETLDDAIQKAADLLAQTLMYDRLNIITFDQNSQTVSNFYKGGPGFQNVVTVSYSELQDGLSGWVLQTHRSALSPKDQIDPRESSAVRERRQATQCGAIVVVPVLFQDRILGTITAINRPEQRDLTENDVAMLESLAGVIGVLIENHSLYRTLRKEVRLRQAMQTQLERAYFEMEQRVNVRTEELKARNQQLQFEIDEREQAEARFQLLIQSDPNGILLVNEDGIIQVINAQIEKDFGYTRAELVGQNVDILLPERSRQKHSLYLKTYKNQPHVRPMGKAMDLWGLHKEGREFPVDIALIPMEMDKEQLVMATIVDITERRQIEAERNLLENRLQTVMNVIPEGVQIIGFDWRYLYLNTTVIKQSSYATGEDLLGFTMMEKYPGIEQTEVFRVLQHCMTEHVSQQMENRFAFPDGSEAWFELNIHPVPEGLFVLSRDITAKKELDEKIHYQALLLQNINDAIIATDSKYTITNWNLAAQAMYGWSAEEVLGKQLGDIMQTRYISVTPDEVLAQFNLSGTWQSEVTQQRKDGTRITVWSSVAQVFDAQGQPLAIVAVNRDITERKKTENELQRSNAELEQFAYVASHDLQEPLRAVAGMVQLLGQRYKGKLDERADEYINHAVEASGRMQNLINDLLEYSRVGRINRMLVPSDLGRCLEMALANLNAAIQETGARVTYDPLPTAMADTGQITQVFQNLISNAIKFRSLQPVAIHIEAVKMGDMWQLAVRDNGIGIEPQYFERIFQIFQRLHTRREYPGTGIGLALCKKIIEHHGGKIWIESQPGNGSTFYFTLRSSSHESQKL
jgi:PAS domain S-box-containing protein